METKDAVRFNDIVGNEIKTYNVDYLVAYYKNKNFIIHTASSKIKSFDFIPKQAMLNLNKYELSRFYLKIPEGIIEVT